MDPLIKSAVKIVCVSGGALLLSKTNPHVPLHDKASCHSQVEQTSLDPSSAPPSSANPSDITQKYSSAFYSIHYSQSPRLRPGHLDRYDVDWSAFAPAQPSTPADRGGSSRKISGPTSEHLLHESHINNDQIEEGSEVVSQSRLSETSKDENRTLSSNIPVHSGGSKCTYKCTPQESDVNLQSVQVFFRHGSRIPLNIVPQLPQVNYESFFERLSTPYTRMPFKVVALDLVSPRPDSPFSDNNAKIMFGKCEAGQLTTKGRDQMYNLGLRLKRDYVGKDKLLSGDYAVDKIKIRSTNITRCIDSLQCVITGLYDRNQFTDEHPLIIPVQHESLEILYPNMRYCQQLWKRTNRDEEIFIKRPEVIQLVEDLESALDTDIDVSNFDAMSWKDNVMIQKYLGFEVPEDLLDLLPKLECVASEALRVFVLGYMSDKDNFKRGVAGRPLFHLIKGNMINSQKDSPKVSLYACHDSSLMLLLGMCEALSGVKPLCREPVNCDPPHGAFWPPYASDIRFELYADPANPDDKWVKIIFNDKPLIAEGFNTPERCLIRFKKLVDLLDSNTTPADDIENCQVYKDA